jgi:HlyD family secretion protein
MGKRYKKYMIYAGALLLLASCNGKNKRSDAYGNFETTETIISSEVSGKLILLSIDEGVNVAAGQRVAVIDSTQNYLKQQQLIAQKDLVRSKKESAQAAIDVLQQQLKNAQKERVRVQNLVKESAAPAKQLDDIDYNTAVLQKQIASTQTQFAAINAEMLSVDAQLAQVVDQLHKSYIINPVAGTVIETYIEQGEIVAPGKAVYKVADLSTMYLRAYISGDQISQVVIGKQVKVLIDNVSGGLDTLKGVVSWISSQSEFTPKIIQTRDERVNLVYAFKVKVANDKGILKSGMPGEVVF